MSKNSSPSLKEEGERLLEDLPGPFCKPQPGHSRE
jgi:hypothetical protein